ncbi:phosphodiester glycosidase family protein [Deinococcus altitudinis]|uniref:phosphodiester glycosidase family protein n=1 Tax=Deinococcus altitudinis TaxID=468914 RepID=UPI0038929670
MNYGALLSSLALDVQSAAAAAALPPAPLTLGHAGLTEQRTSSVLLPGVTLTSITRGQLSAVAPWSVTLAAVATPAAAEKLLTDLKTAGFEARLDPMQVQGVFPDALGYMVRVGQFSSRVQADAAQVALKAKGFGGDVQNVLEDGGPSTGPWVIQVVTVQPNAQAVVKVAIASDVLPGRETTSALARRLGAVAAINGGYFVIDDAGGTEGVPAGISVKAGQVIRETVNGRPGFFIDSGNLKASVIQGLTSTITLDIDGQTHTVTGLNRKPGILQNCGNPVAMPTTLPVQDYACHSANELIQFNAAFGPTSDAGEGYEVSVDATGTVIAGQPRCGAPIPVGGYTLQGIGTDAEWLQRLKIGTRVRVVNSLKDARGHEIPLMPSTYAVNGGPTLVIGSNAVDDYRSEGWSPQALAGDDVAEKDAATSGNARLSFFNDWLLRRNPRTAVGIMKDGTLLFVTVDGRNPTHSVGASIPELTTLMLNLGAVDAMNLDGGGSTATYVNGQLQGVPSDATGERPDGDAIVILPKP